MSVLIDNMRMPKKYPVSLTIWPNGIYTATTISGRKFSGVEAVELPPHGRLGDLDALLKEVNRIYDQYDAGIISEITCMNALSWAIRNAPTIIPAEEE